MAPAAARRAPSPAPELVQGTLDELGTPLSEVTFVVVDLETTGASATSCGITELGAVKVRGGRVVGEMSTLVRPEQAIPAAIAVLTGITDAMVATAPRIGAVLPTFLEFARGCVLVAHNAPFDVGFLVAACERTGTTWPRPQVVDTVRLSRQVLGRDEVRNHKLSTLARHFGASTAPTHRALDDARATVDVLHALLARVGGLGVTTLEELATYSARVPEQLRRKRHLADGVPSAPGVYLFSDAEGRVLYVGTSGDLRARVRSYFTASERRSRMAEMVALAARVTPVVCATPLEAAVRELRLIAEHDPRYNRRSRRPDRAPWVKLTAEPFPRLSVVHQVRDDAAAGAAYLGPFSTRSAAEAAVAALHGAFALRQCTGRLPLRPSPSAAACVLAEMGRCGAPCTGAQSAAEYARVVEAVRAAVLADPEPVLSASSARLARLAEAERYEEAAAVRDRSTAFLRAAARTQRLAPLAAAPELAAARRTADGGWELVVVRYGRLAGSAACAPGADPRPHLEALRATAEAVARPPLPAPAGTPEEAEKVLRWLEQDGVRLVSVEGEWSCPVRGAAGRARDGAHGPGHGLGSVLAGPVPADAGGAG
ncbi:DEDD exonuclease domain-containing protein [Quadrisphaera sp. DSM 44207]|uniref:DEDD exonuclease domain-containing protein n=1 Tax=Quadrisphaera sp. DSM 44207 TaxID=1881057 RepID=UPI00088FC70B|nr:DEDD exonuclease domain-containing protein [Quadrisphaera sp. DSM 44207]SDQ33258.1 DNA polymerase-3 subunit epsilon [Quadrisphaera sp. DSM 44207]